MLGSGFLAGALAFLTGEAAARRGDARVLRLSAALVCSSGFLALHALATPGVLLAGKNAGFQVASAAGLLLAAPICAWSALPLDRGGASVVGRRGLLYAAIGAALALWAGVSLATLPPLDDPIEDPGPLLLALFAVGAVLYAAAAAGYLRLYARRRRPLLLAAVGAFVLLAEAMLAIGLGRNWHVTWWEWHLLMLVAFALVARAAWADLVLAGAAADSVAGAVTVTGVPEGVRAPVMRVSSLSSGRTAVVFGTISASAIRRVMSRRWSGVTRVTTVPEAPARAVRPPRCR